MLSSHLSASRRSATLALAMLLGAACSARSQSASPSVTLAGRPTDPAPARTERATATAAMATRATVAPTLDGRTDDAAWQNAQLIDQFLQYEPNEGTESRFRTEARVTYDDRNLYVLVRMYDPAPDSIVSLLSRRDVRTASEQIKVVIDSYNDDKTGYEFIVNPAGVKRDFSVSNDNNEDASWDGVWDVATKIDSLGWVAEFRIPFSQIRFAPGAEHTFGLLIGRDVARTAERISWPLLSRKVNGYVSQAGTLSGIVGLPTPRRLEIVPYAVVKNSTRDFGEPRAGGLGRYDHPSRATVGADLKYGLSSNLTLDATINPDFGQVESDPAQLNLTAFETFFDERRPFFLEGAGIFKFNTNCGDIDSGCTGLFYSRRIGRSPQLSGEYGDATSPTATPIAAAAKLTGRLSNGFSIGLLDALTERVEGVEFVDGGNAAIEPRANYSVLRVQRDHADGRGDVGLMLTGVNRALDAGAAPFLTSGAYSAGLDFRRRFVGNNYELRTFLAASDVRGSPDAIAALQTNTVHAFQRPDDDVAYDPTRTSMRGNAQRVSFSKFGGGVTRFQSVYQRFSPGFETNDIGYQQRADQQMFRNWFALQFQKPTRFYRKAFFNFNAQERWTTDGLVLGNSLNHNLHVQLPSQWWVHLGANANDLLPAYGDRDARGGPAIRHSKNASAWAGFESDDRKSVTYGVWTSAWKGDDGRSWSADVSPNLNMRVSSRFSASMSVDYSRNADNGQFYESYGDVGSDTTHYTFARLDQTTIGISTRLNITATPNLSFQFYGQPYVSSGTYADWRELDQPRSSDYDRRFKKYGTTNGIFDGFNFREFRSNAVLRYEYRPGSTLFVVWQQGRSDYITRADEGYNEGSSFGRDYRSTFRDHPNNTFLVKWSYWLNP